MKSTINDLDTVNKFAIVVENAWKKDLKVINITKHSKS